MKFFATPAAREVQQSGQPITLEPMVAADRRTVHTALRDWAGLETVSVDEDPDTGMKRVQVVPAGRVPASRDAAETPTDEQPPTADEPAGRTLEEGDQVETFPSAPDEDEETPPKSFPPLDE